MAVMMALPADDPRMKAWEAYKATPEYANTRKWALHEAHVEGSLWAAFLEGLDSRDDRWNRSGDSRDAMSRGVRTGKGTEMAGERLVYADNCHRQGVCEALAHEVAALRVEAERLREERAALIEALEFYGHPGTYFAIGFLPDPPCGDLMEDFGDTELGRKPGERARAALDALERRAKPDALRGGADDRRRGA